ncbi:hypothetical protein [Sphingobium yanoikuyae]
MARELRDAAKELVFDRDEMATIELMLGMGQGYVLDFNDRTFDEFIRRHWNLDSTAPIYTELGTSKANRLRGILKAFKDSSRAEVLQRFLDYRNHPTRVDQIEKVSDGVHQSYLDIIKRLEGERPIESADWTERPSLQSRVVMIKRLAPLVLNELSDLIERVEEKRFNDPETADALKNLKRLHNDVGLLISAIENQRPIATILGQIELHRDKLTQLVKRGAKVGMVAPAMTLGISNMLSWLCGLTLDSTMVSAVYVSLIGAEALGGFEKERRT